MAAILLFDEKETLTFMTAHTSVNCTPLVASSSGFIVYELRNGSSSPFIDICFWIRSSFSKTFYVFLFTRYERYQEKARDITLKLINHWSDQWLQIVINLECFALNGRFCIISYHKITIFNCLGEFYRRLRYS